MHCCVITLSIAEEEEEEHEVVALEKTKGWRMSARRQCVDCYISPLWHCLRTLTG